jgi:hypothetical protein
LTRNLQAVRTPALKKIGRTMEDVLALLPTLKRLLVECALLTVSALALARYVADHVRHPNR